MGLYDRCVLPCLIDFACGLPMVQAQRQKLIPQARGRVLEVGMGTGRNLPFYDRSRISRLVGVDPALQMHRLAQQRSSAAGIEVELMGLSAEQLPTADASFDTVVCTYTLCTMVVRPTRTFAAGKTDCSRFGGRWWVVVSWGVTFLACWMLQASRPPRKRPTWPVRAP